MTGFPYNGNLNKAPEQEPPRLDILHRARGKEHGLLADVADELPPCLHRDFAKVDAVHQHLLGLGAGGVLTRTPSKSMIHHDPTV